MSRTNVSQGTMVRSFETYPAQQRRRSGFNRDNWVIGSMNSGYIVPIWFDEAYPGDTIAMRIKALVRLATPIVPFMYPAYMDVHVWAVPHRLLWKNWVKMHGEQENPGDSTDYLTPQLTSNGTNNAIGTIYDYFGIRPGVSGIKFNSFNFRAYNLVYNEFYRDENLQDTVPFTRDDSGDTLDDYVLLRRGKRKDYFTGALPFPQKGEAVDIPLGTSAPVYGNGQRMPIALPGLTSELLYMGVSSSTDGNQYIQTRKWSDNSLIFKDTAPSAFYYPDKEKLVNAGLDLDNAPMFADLSEATAATIDSLYQAFAVQRVLHRDAIGGSRYIEMILAHFGVQSPDARLQRPEFLGGGSFDLDLSVVPQTSSSDSTTPQGNLSAFGVINGYTKRVVKSFTEHTVLFAVACIRAPYVYQYGLDKIYSRHSRFDYYLPLLDNLGEQAILNKEIFATGTSKDEEVFGYQERWAEMRYKQNRVVGQLRSDAEQSLDYWHLAEEFADTPRLNSEFIEERPPFDRVIAVPESANTPQFIFNFAFDENWYRPMSIYSIPGLQTLGMSGIGN